MNNNQKMKFFIGIDLGWKEKKTTGICVLEGKKLILLKDIFGKNVLKTIKPYLKETETIAIDAPLTPGKGKGEMRLYEKFLSTRIFRQEKTNPTPPILMPELCEAAEEIVEKLGEKGFVLNLNLIEIFPTLVKKICGKEIFLSDLSYQTENQESAIICAKIAFLHPQFKTRYLGYKDGFLFLPEMSFWKPEWRQKFYQAWMGRDRLKYHHLITNIFSK